jgi:hypothetical protein
MILIAAGFSFLYTCLACGVLEEAGRTLSFWPKTLTPLLSKDVQALSEDDVIQLTEYSQTVRSYLWFSVVGILLAIILRSLVDWRAVVSFNFLSSAMLAVCVIDALFCYVGNKVVSKFLLTLDIVNKFTTATMSVVNGTTYMWIPDSEGSSKTMLQTKDALTDEMYDELIDYYRERIRPWHPDFGAMLNSTAYSRDVRSLCQHIPGM